MRNYDAIKNMSVEDMAEFIFDMSDCQSCRATLFCEDVTCQNAINKFLESEANSEQ